MNPNAGVLLSRRVVNPETGCWEWRGTRSTRGGYGLIHVGGSARYLYVHRVAAALFLGFDLASRQLVCHHCDNPSCFNPDHLFVGTQSDNCLDRSQKGRGRENRQRGADNPHAKLSAQAVRDIRAALVRGETQVSLSKRYGVIQPHISRIARREQWVESSV